MNRLLTWPPFSEQNAVNPFSLVLKGGWNQIRENVTQVCSTHDVVVEMSGLRLITRETMRKWLHVWFGTPILSSQLPKPDTEGVDV